jgi:hypothetical protein
MFFHDIFFILYISVGVLFSFWFFRRMFLAPVPSAKAEISRLNPPQRFKKAMPRDSAADWGH